MSANPMPFPRDEAAAWAEYDAAIYATFEERRERRERDEILEPATETLLLAMRDAALRAICRPTRTEAGR